MTNRLSRRRNRASPVMEQRASKVFLTVRLEFHTLFNGMRDPTLQASHRLRASIILLLALLGISPAAVAGGVDQAKLESLYRAGKAIEAATGVGVSYVQFGEYV